MKETEESTRPQREPGEPAEDAVRRAREASVALLRAAYPANAGLPHRVDFPPETP